MAPTPPRCPNKDQYLGPDVTRTQLSLSGGMLLSVNEPVDWVRRSLHRRTAR